MNASTNTTVTTDATPSMMMMTTMQHHNCQNVMKTKMISKKSAMRLSILTFRNSMIMMILLVSSCSLLTTTLAQIIGSINTAGTALIQMKVRSYKPYALIFLHANSNSGNSNFINITDANMIDDSDICYNEFQMISNMLYTTYTSALLVETPLTTETLQTLDYKLVDSEVFTSVAAVVDGTSDQNIIIVHQEALPLPPPLDVNMISFSPSPTPTYQPTFKPSSSLRPSPTDITLPSYHPSRMPSHIPTTLEQTERTIDDGINVTTTDDEDSFSVIVGEDVCATLIIEVVVPTPSSSPSSEPSRRPSSKPSSTPSSKPSSTPSSKPSSRPSSRPITAPVPAPLPTGPNTFTGIFTLVRTDRSSSSSAASIFMGNYSSGATINISSFVNVDLSLNVDFRCCFRQVRMDYTGSTQTFTNWEGGAPYALNGNSGNDYNNVDDLSISGPKRIVVYGYNGSNQIITNVTLNFNIVGGRPARRVLSSPVIPSFVTPASAPVPSAPVPSAPVPSAQCTRRRLLEEEEEEIVSNHDDNDVRNLKHEDLDDVDNYDFENMSNEHRRLTYPKICHVRTCDLSRYVIGLFGCRSYCISIGEYRRKQRSLLRREQSQEQSQHEHEQNHVERKSQSIPNIGLYRKGKRDAIIRGRGDVTAAIFYKYVKQYIPNDHVCQPILSSMTYIIVDVDVL